MRPHRFACTAAALAIAAAPAAAQRPLAQAARTNRAAIDTTGGAGAFAAQAVGGSAGALAGIALGASLRHCGVEDLACDIATIGTAGALGVAGATLGTVLAARLSSSRASAPGALLGALVGTGAGLGVHYLLNRGTDRNLGDRVVIPIFALSQGVGAAVGSRLVRR